MATSFALLGYPRNSTTEGAPRYELRAGGVPPQQYYRGGNLRVIGVGNILLCDEGIGVHVVRELSSRGETPGVEYVDGGVAGATLLNLVEGEERVVLVDAVDAPFPPGTVVRMTPDELVGSGAPAWSLHDLNLADTIGMMRLRETLPEMILLGVVPADIETYSLELSGPIAARFGEIVEKVRSEIAAFAAPPRP